MSVFVDLKPKETAQKLTINLAQPVGEYTLTVASGDIYIKSIAVYVNSAGLGLTSVSIYTNHLPSTMVLTTTDGALANLTAGRLITTTGGRQTNIYLKAGDRIYYAINGLAGTAGTISVIVNYIGVDVGSYLT